MVRVNGSYINMNIPDYEIFENIELNRIEILPNRSGIYFLISTDGRILYIGESDNINNRCRNHNKIQECISQGDFINSISYILIDDYLERIILEKAYIKAYKPNYNNETMNFNRLY